MDQVIVLKLTQAEIALVIEAIGNMPLNRVVNVFARIQQQIAPQLGTPLGDLAVTGNGHATPDNGG